MKPGAVLVCVTGQPSCERLIRRGAALAQAQGLTLLALCAAGSGLNDLGDPQVAAALDLLYRACARHGAEMTVLCSVQPLETVADFARAQGAVHLVLGEGRGDPGESFAARLAKRLPEAQVHVVPAEAAEEG